MSESHNLGLTPPVKTKRSARQHVPNTPMADLFRLKRDQVVSVRVVVGVATAPD